MKILSSRAAVACIAALCAGSGALAQNQTHQVLPAAAHYLSLTRPVFSAQRAYDQVAFMDQYFRWPGNTGFNASIHRVEDILKAAGYVEEATAKPGGVLTYRIEHRPIKQPAWEPVAASVTCSGAGPATGVAVAVTVGGAAFAAGAKAIAATKRTPSRRTARA